MPVEGTYGFRPGFILDELFEMESISALGPELWREAMVLKLEIEEYTDIFPDLLAQVDICTAALSWSEVETKPLAEEIWGLLQQPDSDLAILLAKSPCCNAKTYRILTYLLSTGQIQMIE